MNQTTTQQKLRHVFRTSLNLANLVEDMLEQSSDFNPVFKKGLQQSLKEAKDGKTLKVNSLKEH